VHLAVKYDVVATVLMIFLRINLPNVFSLKSTKTNRPGPHILLFKAKFFTTVKYKRFKHYLLTSKHEILRSSSTVHLYESSSYPIIHSTLS